MQRRPRLVPTSKHGDTWLFPPLGPDEHVEFVIPSAEEIAKLQPVWESCGNRGSQKWNWVRINHEFWETLALRQLRTGEVLVLAASRARRLLLLEVGKCYRLDLLETNPRWLGIGLATFMVHILAGRALEAGADGLVLASTPEAVSFYEQLGGTARKVGGWNVRSDLYPFFFDAKVLRSMWESIDG